MRHQEAVALSLLSVLLVLSACDDKRPTGQGIDRRLTVRGLLTRAAGIGGETAGWVVVLDQPVEVEGIMLNLLEVEFDPQRWPIKEDVHVEATGRIVFRTGVERGRYPLLRVERFTILPKTP